MRIFHICSGYAQQKLYSELIANLELAIDAEQFVYVPVRSTPEIDRHRNNYLTKTSYRFAHVLRRHHRVFFRRKIAAIYRDLTTTVDVRDISVVHAHFLFSDGAVALQLNREFDLPYVTAVRNTDLNYFMRLRPDLMPLCREIVRQSSAVIFVSPAYRDEFVAKLRKNERDKLLAKSKIVPNGVAAYWLENRPSRRTHDGSRIRLMYVGRFTRNKNVANIIRAADILANEVDTRLTLVGGGGDATRTISKMLKSGRHSSATFVGRIDSREELRDTYRRHDIFVMPSFLETFGVSYIEALSQGLPVVHSRGQGVDGYFAQGTVAESVNPNDPDEIAAAIRNLAGRLPLVRNECMKQALQFDWSRIAEIYAGFYMEAQSWSVG